MVPPRAPSFGAVADGWWGLRRERGLASAVEAGHITGSRAWDIRKNSRLRVIV
jgi:hypothetical protein